MPLFTHTWTGPVQAALASTSDQVAQYRELFLLIHTQLKALGYTVERSSDGAAAADSDLIADASDVIWGTGAQAKSWALYRLPAGKGRPVASPGPGLLLIAANANTDTTTPNNIQLVVGTGTLTTAGSHTVTPGWTSQTAITVALIPDNSPVASSYAVWTNSNNDLYIGFKQSGDAFFKTFIGVFDDVRAAEDGGPSGDNTIVVFGASAFAVPGALGAQAWNTYSNLAALLSNGNGALTTVRCWYNVSDFAVWEGGADEQNGLVPLFPIQLACNTSTAGQARWLGGPADIYMCPVGVPFNEIDSLDDLVNAPHQLRATGGCLMIPCDEELWVTNP